MTSILSIFLIAFLLLLSGLSIYNASSLSIKPKNFSFSVPLIHISSTESPFYNPSNTPDHLLRDGIQTSLARSRYFTERHYSAGKLKLLKRKNADVGARLPLFKDFVMKYSIGTPPVETFSLVDTGNSLIWLQCLPCIKCYPQPIPIFDPTKSSSFKIVSCGTPECSTVPHRNCTPDGTTSCWFKKVYGDGTSTEGFISRDTFRLANSVGRPTTTLIHEMIFGCGYYNIYSDFPGVIGLGNAEYSLVGQLGYSRFSYFFTDQNHGWIHFGALAIISGSGSGSGLTTPFVPNQFGHYLLILEAITVSGEKLNIPPETFQMTSDGEGGFIIDSGTSFTLLNSVAFSALRSRVREVMVGQVAESFEGFELCYRRNNISSSIFFPPAVPPVLLEISFNFKDMDFVVSQNNLWIEFQSSGLNCLAFLNNHINKISILGLYQQRNINVGYDLRANQLTLSYP